jgi:4-hydroxythreonine-4-phosphate dehydrogenase
VRKSKSPLPVVGISLGDPSGIGPEIVDSALRAPAVRKRLLPVVFGDRSAFDAFPAFAGLERRPPQAAERPLRAAFCEVSHLPARDRRPGKPTRAGGQAQFDCVQAAIQAARHGWLDALCTAPVSKEQITRAGIPFMGHTELLAEAFGVETLMMMDGPLLRVALATNHLPLAEVPGALQIGKLSAQLELLSRSLRPLLGRAPRIGVCGLNPHAGEGGLLGREEVTILGPAILAARKLGVNCEGPLPADGLFARVGQHGYDVVLAMFHDQGLIAAKTLDFKHTVNVTLGLPLPRTSPDHGVAYDLAGTGRASAVPMTEALLKAAAMVKPGPR